MFLCFAQNSLAKRSSSNNKQQRNTTDRKKSSSSSRGFHFEFCTNNSNSCGGIWYFLCLCFAVCPRHESRLNEQTCKRAKVTISCSNKCILPGPITCLLTTSWLLCKERVKEKPNICNETTRAKKKKTQRTHTTAPKINE